MKFFSQPIFKRLLFCISFGIAFGFVCAFFASIGMKDDQPYWWSPLMWGIVYNRVLIGLLVFFAGGINICEKCHIKIWPSIRGFFVGALVSLDLSIWFLLVPDVERISILILFFSSIFVGGVYGMITDIVATHVIGDGMKVEKGWIK